jgi:hypothetical protein
VPATQLGSQLALPLFFLGFFVHSMGLLYAGIALFGAVVLFQLVTLPTEFNASRRAKEVLASSGIVSTPEEAQGVSKVLNAAALTYVAAAVTAVVQLLYLIALASRRR